MTTTCKPNQCAACPNEVNSLDCAERQRKAREQKAQEDKTRHAYNIRQTV